MIYNLKDYQLDAVESLKVRLKLYIDEINRGKITSGVIVFKAPTGSGKTFMITGLIEDLTNEIKDQFCIIWACPGTGDLHIQSHDAVRFYLGGNPTCSLIEDEFFGSRKYIKNREVVFVNWEKLDKKDRATGGWSNNLMKDKEGANFLNVLKQTKINGTKIILIVDESHIGASQAARINEFRNTIIQPEVTIEMSATPLSRADVEVNPQDVVEEGMIKKDVIVNEGILKEDRSLEDADSEQLVLQKGFDKRIQLLNEYKKENSDVNPLCLIQIPNSEAGDAKKEVIRDFLRSRGITEENGKLKFWCDTYEFFDKKAIKRKDDITEFLVFKVAVATGWDCPRAQILIKFREGKSETFETQTIGRILRTPEAKSYDNDILDNAYIFTNIKDFETKQDTYNPNRIKTAFSKIKDPYSQILVQAEMQLESFYRSRQGNFNDAKNDFNAFYLNEFMKFFELSESDQLAIGDSLKEKLESKGLNLSIRSSDELIEETHLDIKKIDTEQAINSENAIVQMSENDINAVYYKIISDNLSGLAYKRSKGTIDSAIQNTLALFYNVFPRSLRVSAYQHIVVNNSEIFSQILSAATRNYREYRSIKSLGNVGDTYLFRIEQSRAYSTETHTVLTSKKSIYEPLYVLKDAYGNPKNYLEKSFLNYLDSQEKVEWYWENGTELMRINFGIPYLNGLSTFQPDFIVRFKNGTIGIFDTKGVGFNVDDTKAKAEALYQFISQTNSTREGLPPIIGGIVIKHNSQFYVFNEKEYKDFEDDSSNWRNFNDLLQEIVTFKDIEKAINAYMEALTKN